MTLELKSVEKKVGSETWIYPTDLVLQEGAFNILLGTTRAGKTTLMQLMAGLEKPTAGEIWFNGENVTGRRVQDRNVAMVYQQFINYPNLSVYDNIASPLNVLRLSASEIKQRVDSVAALLKLEPYLKRRPAELSGGQQQRCALARALVKDADLILLDEPLANLDYKLREELREELPKLFEDRKCTVVYATSEPMEALLLGGYTATLAEGRVTQYGETATAYRNPVDLTSAKVFSDPPINSAQVQKQGGEFILGGKVRWPIAEKHAALGDGAYVMAIRPHHISPTPQHDQAVSIDGHVVVTELAGSESIVHFHLADGEPWVSQAHGIHDLEVGMDTTLHMDTAHCLYFDTNGALVAT